MTRKIHRSAETGEFVSAEEAKANPSTTVTETVAISASPSHLRVTGFRGNPLRVVLSNGEEATIKQKMVDTFASPSPFGDPAEGALLYALQRIRDRLDGKWYDPTGDLESDLKAVLKELDQGTPAPVPRNPGDPTADELEIIDMLRIGAIKVVAADTTEGSA